MRVTTIFSAVTLAASVLADGNGIISAIGTVRTQVDALGKAVSSWSGDLEGSLSLSVKSNLLYRDVIHGMTEVSRSGPLWSHETEQIVNATEVLGTRFRTTIDVVISAKPKFDPLFLSPIVNIRLGFQKTAAHDFFTQVAAKLPGELQAKMRDVIKAVDNNFDKAIAAYK